MAWFPKHKRKFDKKYKITIYLLTHKRAIELIPNIGIEAKVTTSPYDMLYTKIQFKNNEDLNLFKVVSGIKKRRIVTRLGDEIECDNTYV
jgi:hypothetical protein